MDEESSQTVETRSVGWLFLPSIVISRLATMPPGIIMTLLLIEIGLTFGLPVGVTGQIGTAGSIAAFLSALLMGLLSVRFKHRSLLMTGLLIFSLSLLGRGLAPNFILFLMFGVLGGLAGPMITPMTNTLVAKHLPLKKRTRVFGLLIAAGSFSYLIGFILIRFISDIGGWRFPFLVYALPFPLLGLLLAFKGLPSESGSSQTSSSTGSLTEGYKGVLSSRSADACLMCNALAGAVWSGFTLYGASFYRQQFLASKGVVTYFMMGAALAYTIGALICNRFVNRFGRKPVTLVSAFTAGLFVLCTTIVSNLWVSLALCLTGYLFMGLRSTAATSLTIEQVPEFRGTMMSMNSASGSMSGVLGSGLGGLALLMYGYQALGPSLGLLGLVSGIIMYLVVVDPTRVQG
jgi:predicted MFS family arabinose efflux permease